MPRQFMTLPAPRIGETPHAQVFIPQSDGRAGVEETLAVMTRAKNEYKTHPTVRGLALKLIASLPQKDYAGEINTLATFVKHRIRYARDVAGVETIQSPLKTLEFGAGDCDDKSTLLSAMLESIGHKTRFKAVGVNGGELCHVYPQVLVGTNWLSLETTEPEAVGWEPAGITDTVYSVSGLGGFEYGWSPDGVKEHGDTFTKNMEAQQEAQDSRARLLTKLGAQYNAWIDGFVNELKKTSPDIAWERLIYLPQADDVVRGINTGNKNSDVARLADTLTWAYTAQLYNTYMLKQRARDMNDGTVGVKNVNNYSVKIKDGSDKITNEQQLREKRDYAARQALLIWR